MKPIITSKHRLAPAPDLVLDQSTDTLETPIAGEIGGVQYRERQDRYTPDLEWRGLDAGG